MKIYEGVEALIGCTPLMRLSRLEKQLQLSAKVLGKAEWMNPGGSVKDRPALEMLLQAEAEGILPPGGTVIEPTSGNTGIALAMLAAARGYRAVIVMPDSMSVERRQLMRAYGAEVILTPGDKGMQGAVDYAHDLAAKTAGAFVAGQFDNPANPQAHQKSTAEEIWADTDGQVDVLVSCVGTGGTFSGTAKALTAKNPDLIAVAVEPEESPLISCGKAGKHGIQGIGANFVPKNFDRSLCDRVVTVSTQEATQMARLLVRTEGLLAGISSGAALCAAQKLARQEEFRGKNIVVILPDGGEKYLSAGVFD